MGKGKRARAARQNPKPKNGQPSEPATRWNGEPCEAIKLSVVVGDNGFFPQYWAKDLVGTVRKAVRVDYGQKIFYLDNEDGSGWHKVTHGGGPGLPSRSLDIKAEVR